MKTRSYCRAREKGQGVPCEGRSGGARPSHGSLEEKLCTVQTTDFAKDLRRAVNSRVTETGPPVAGQGFPFMVTKNLSGAKGVAMRRILSVLFQR